MTKIKINKHITTERIERVLDVVIASLLLVLLMPASVLLINLIPLESKGGAFFLQKRVGKHNRIFTIYKFRTMTQNHIKNIDDGNCFLPASKNKHRITKLGSILRKTHLDEIPQLFNVLRGDMSIVGVRPDLPVQLKNYSNDQLTKRHIFRPGITGRAQLSNEANLYSDARLREDLLWIEKNSLKLYFKYIFLTILKIFKLSGT